MPPLHSSLSHDRAARKGEPNGGLERRGDTGDSDGRAHVAMSRRQRRWQRRANPCQAPPSLPHLAAPSPVAPQPAGTRSRRRLAVDSARRAPPEPSQSTPGRPPLPSFLHASPPCPFGPLSIPQPSHTRANPPASSHDRGRPLHRVHRAPPGRYLSRPEPRRFPTPHHHLSPLTPLSLVHRLEGGAVAAKPRPPKPSSSSPCPR